ncbi:MAG: hypothetical protein JSW11_02900 [Candidatus Heimdallarchaeota archaeon]|nr:MAG: hypothetical protein JSW11_02900 [Candidatus Heimdallarchaeota archaeon]
MRTSQSEILSTKKEKMRKLPKQISGSELKKIIFAHWQKIPVIKEIPGPMPEELVLQLVRSAILDILRNGIEEYDERNDLTRIRHVFSVKELHKLIKERISKKIKLSNVYFHLNQLKDHDFVQIITSIKEGRQITHYYGRTAKLFLWMGKEQKRETEFSHFMALIQYFNPDITSETVKELFMSLLQTKLENHNRAKIWLEKNVDVLTELNVDTRDFYNFLKSIDSCNPRSIEVYNKINELLNFPADSNV